MELAGFQPRERSNGDQLPAREAVDRMLVVLVREHRGGIVTKFKPEGGEGVVVDVADVQADSVWIDVLWMNGAIVDNLAPYVGQAVPIKLTWTASQSGGNPYIGVSPLDGDEMAKAAAWAQVNPNRFDTERAQRNGTPTPAPDAPAAPAAPADPNDPAVQALLQQINGGSATS